MGAPIIMRMDGSFGFASQEKLSTPSQEVSPGSTPTAILARLQTSPEQQAPGKSCGRCLQGKGQAWNFLNAAKAKAHSPLPPAFKLQVQTSPEIYGTWDRIPQGK